METILQKIRDDVPGDMVLSSEWVSPMRAGDTTKDCFAPEFCVLAMTPESAKLLASLSEKLRMERLGIVIDPKVEKLPGIRLLGICTWYPNPDVPLPDVAEKIKDFLHAPQISFPVTQDEYAEIARYLSSHPDNVAKGCSTIEITSGGKIKVIVRDNMGREYGSIRRPEEIMDIFVKTEDDRLQTGMSL